MKRCAQKERISLSDIFYRERQSEYDAFPRFDFPISEFIVEIGGGRLQSERVIPACGARPLHKTGKRLLGITEPERFTDPLVYGFYGRNVMTDKITALLFAVLRAAE